MQQHHGEDRAQHESVWHDASMLHLRSRRVQMGVSLVLTVFAVAAAAWLITNGTRGAEIAGIVGLVLGLLVPLWAWLVRTPETSHEALQAAAVNLALKVSQEASASLQRALGESAGAEAADVQFRQPNPQIEAELLRWRADGGAAEGTLQEIESYYLDLSRGRMVILGEPGSGKTVLAYHLVRELARRVIKNPKDFGPELLVPVWATLPSWEPGDAQRLSQVRDSDLVAEFDSWLIKRIIGYGIPQHLAEALVRKNLILPILDGLDEMDGNAGAGTDEELLVRASAVVRVLNSYESRPLVLTCRKVEYRRLTTVRRVGGRAPVVEDAQQVIIEPLSSGQVASYIERRRRSDMWFKGDPASVGWKEVIQNLRDEPNGDLAAVLRTPWRLFLALTAYREEGSHPEHMIGQTESELSGSLLAQLIPAIVEQHPRPRGGYYDHKDVQRWLTTIARELHRSTNRIFSTPVDIRVEELWRAGGEWVGRAVRAIPLLVVYGITLSAVMKDTFATWYKIVLVLVLLVASPVFIWGSNFSAPFRRLDKLKFRQRRMQRLMALRVITGVVGLMAYGEAVFFLGWRFGAWQSDVQANSAAAILTMAIFGAQAGAWWAIVAVTSDAAALRRPSDVLRQAAIYDLVGVFVFPVLAVPVLILSTWPRHLVGTQVAYHRRRLPRRPVQFLDWAYESGLLRLSGGAIQFRHRELQDWLIGQQSPELPTTASAT